MASEVTNCAKIRRSMTDVASGVFSDARTAEFHAHLLSCLSCRREFDHMQTLMQTIDRSVSAWVAAEPSPRLIASVRRAIAEQPNHAREWWPRSAWLTAAGVCAALAICVLVMRTSRDRQRTAAQYAAHPLNATSVQNGVAVTSDPVPSRELAYTPSPRKLVFSAHGHSARAHRLQIAEPKIIVEPGQMQVILRFAAAMQRRQLDGAKLLARGQESDTPLEIKPLTITPLRITALKGESESAISETGQDETRNFAGGRSK